MTTVAEAEDQLFSSDGSYIKYLNQDIQVSAAH